MRMIGAQLRPRRRGEALGHSLHATVAQRTGAPRQGSLLRLAGREDRQRWRRRSGQDLPFTSKEKGLMFFSFMLSCRHETPLTPNPPPGFVGVANSHGE